MLLLQQKKEIHKKILNFLEGKFRSDRKYFPLLAHHALMAEQLFKALDYSEQAGLIAMDNNANEEAVRLLTIALQLYDKLELQDTIRLENFHVNLGEALYSLGRYEESIEHFLSALDLTGNPIPKSEFSIKYKPTKSAALQFMRDRLRWHPKSANSKEAASSFRASQILEKLCQACELQGNADLAAYSAYKLVELCETVEENQGNLLVVGYSLCGYITLVLQKPDLAKKYSDKANTIVSNFPHLPEIDRAMAQHQIGMYTASHGNWHDALWNFKQAKKTFKNYCERKKWRECTLMIGTVLHMKGEFGACLKHFQKLLRYAQEDGDLYLQSNALLWKSLTELALKGASEKIENQLENARSVHKDSHTDHLSIRITMAYNAFHRASDLVVQEDNLDKITEMKTDDEFKELDKNGMGNRSHSMSGSKSIEMVQRFASDKTVKELISSSNLLWFNVYKYVHFLELLYDACEAYPNADKKVRRKLLDTAETVLKAFEKSFPFPYAKCYKKLLEGRLEYLKKQERSAYKHFFKAARNALNNQMPFAHGMALYHIGRNTAAERKAVTLEIARSVLSRIGVKIQNHSQFRELWVSKEEADMIDQKEATEEVQSLAAAFNLDQLESEIEQASGNSGTFGKRHGTFSSTNKASPHGPIPWRMSGAGSVSQRADSLSERPANLPGALPGEVISAMTTDTNTDVEESQSKSVTTSKDINIDLKTPFPE
jgi:tetratricopeptide (TPR) repeat protein